jgi:O-acetylhomoserine/O-acetylserine sulfhydrylase-like pyridoxal-dependent enzyme
MWERSNQVPIAQSVGFGYQDIDEQMGVGLAEEPVHIHSRTTNSTVAGLVSLKRRCL